MSQATDRGQPRWSPVQAETLSWRIVAQVRAALFSGQIKPGDFLGSEGSLAEKFQVSRMASRDALRSLEAVGIVEIRMGNRGGAYIAEGNPNRFADALSIQLQLIGVSADEIFVAQLAIEPVAAELAASRAKPEDLLRLRNALATCKAQCNDKDAFTDASMNFHECIVETSGNRVLLAQFRALRFVLQPILAPNSTQWVARNVIRSHAALLREIAAGNADKAGQLMRQRVASVRAKVVGDPAGSNGTTEPMRVKPSRRKLKTVAAASTPNE